MVRFTLVLGGKKDDVYGDTGPQLAVTRVVAIPSSTVPLDAQLRQ